jgi:hypothetical protein
MCQIVIVQIASYILQRFSSPQFSDAGSDTPFPQLLLDCLVKPLEEKDSEIVRTGTAIFGENIHSITGLEGTARPVFN